MIVSPLVKSLASPLAKSLLGGGSSGAPSLSSSTSFWFPGDEASGDLLDATPNAIDFTERGAPTTATIAGFTGRDVDGASDYWDTTDGIEWNSTWHIAAHIYIDVMPTGTERFPVMAKGTTVSDQREFAFNVNVDGSIQMIVSSDGTNGSQIVPTSDAGLITAGQWYFLEAFHDEDADEVGIAIDGGLWWYEAWANGVFHDAAHLSYIANVVFGANKLGNGKIRNVGRWNRRLTPDERQTIFGAGTPASYPF